MDEIQQVIFNNAGCNQAIFGSEDCLSLSIYTPYVTIENLIGNFIKYNLRQIN